MLRLRDHQDAGEDPNCICGDLIHGHKFEGGIHDLSAGGLLDPSEADQSLRHEQAVVSGVSLDAGLHLEFCSG